MKLSFFSSSDFVIPLIDAVYQANGQLLLDIFNSQIKWLRGYCSNNGTEVTPNWWYSYTKIQSVVSHSPHPLLKSPLSLDHIVSQPERVNRGKIITNPVLEYARSKSITFYTPEKIKDSQEIFKEVSCDVALLASYGQIIPDSILQYPTNGFVNWHPSLLPKYRGASPMQEALKNGDSQTGLTWLEMTKQMDAGDIWLQIPYRLSMHADILTLKHDMIDIGINTWSLPIVAKLMNSENQQ